MRVKGGDTQPTAQDALTGNSAAANPTSCWPRPASQSYSPAPIPDSAVNGTSKSTIASKRPGSPGSTPTRFVEYSRSQGPPKKNDSANASMPWTSLYGILPMSSNRFTGILSTESVSTRRVSMLRIGSWNGPDASGMAATAPVATSTAAARAYGREAASMAPPSPVDRLSGI